MCWWNRKDENDNDSKMNSAVSPLILKSKTHTHLTHPTYRPDIDGLRAIAVLAVIIFHAFPTILPGGFIGVDIFFVISGYLISRIIMESLEKNSFSFGEFYARRVKRIFPALMLVMVAVLAFGWIALFAGEYKQLGKHTIAGAAFLSNLVLWSESGYFTENPQTLNEKDLVNQSPESIF